MKILVLNGSPKRDKSDTMHMTRAFLRGMASVLEAEIETVHVIDRRIEYCTGCFACKKNGGICYLEDEMKSLLEQYVSSDLVIYSFPLYSYGMPAPLKNFVDRLMPLSAMRMVREEGGKYGHRFQYDVDGLRYVMICGCGYPNSKNNFEAAIRQFELKFPHNSTILTVPESPMFNIPQAAPFTTPKVALLEQAGAVYAREGTIPEVLLREVCAPMIPDEIYAQFANGERKN